MAASPELERSPRGAWLAPSCGDAVVPILQASPYIRGAPRTVPEMQLDVLGIGNLSLRVHVTIGASPSELTFRFRTTQPEIDRWLT